MVVSNDVALRRFLDRLLRRSQLSPDEQAAIVNLSSHAFRTKTGDEIVSPGKKVEHACLVVDGLVGRIDQIANGRRQITALHIPGDMCDLHSIVCPVPVWRLEALTTTTILRIPHHDLREAALTYPAIALAFWRDTTADASIVAKWIGNLGIREAHSRLAHLLCEMGIRLEQAGLNARTEFSLSMTQSQLGDALGLTSVHVNRMLKQLRDEGLIRTDRSAIHVADWDGLAAAAEFDLAFLLMEPQVSKRPPD